MQAHMIWQLTHLVMSMLYKYLSIRLRCSVWHPKTLSFLLHTSVAWKWARFVYYLALRAPWYMRQKENFALEPLITCIVCRERMCMFVQADSFIWSTYNIHMHPPSAMYFQPPWYPYHQSLQTRTDIQRMPQMFKICHSMKGKIKWVSSTDQ